MTTRDEYIDKMKRLLDDLNAQLDELEAKAKTGQQQVIEDYEQQMARLRELSGAALARLNALREAGESRWDELVAEGEKVQKAFIHSVNYFRSQLK
jgi:chromosome segregation ATPase